MATTTMESVVTFAMIVGSMSASKYCRDASDTNTYAIHHIRWFLMIIDDDDRITDGMVIREAFVGGGGIAICDKWGTRLLLFPTTAPIAPNRCASQIFSANEQLPRPMNAIAPVKLAVCSVSLHASMGTAATKRPVAALFVWTQRYAS